MHVCLLVFFGRLFEKAAACLTSLIYSPKMKDFHMLAGFPHTQKHTLSERSLQSKKDTFPTMHMSHRASP